MVVMTRLHLAVRGAAALSLALGAFGLGSSAFGADGAAPVLVGHIDGEINPITARYVDRVVSDGESDNAAAVVFVIDTPGGLIDSTYQITARFLSTRVPIVTFVAPAGARAASAGTFITMAGHVAAMAPATNIGAAHPVDSSGGDIQGDLRLKAENDAVAHIVNIAKVRGRNETWAEDAVRNSVSARVDEALTLHVVDLEANDVPDLLAKIDGRTVTTTAGAVTLATKNAPVADDGLNPIETFLHFVVDPQIAVLLFTLGTYGLIFELSNPGLIFPGIIGVIAIILALFSFGTLDADGAGIALMVFALLLFVAEIKVQAHGLLTAGGVAALVIGLIIVFPPFRPTFPGVRQSVEPLLVVFVVGLTAIFFGVALRVALRPLPVASGASLLLGAVGVAKTDIAPRGIAHVAGEAWTVVSEGGDIPKGGAVRVKRVDSVRLLPPPIQSGAQTVDLREFVVEIPQQTCITKDNAPISIDFLIYQKVVEPKDSFLNIQNFRQAIQGIATTTLRAVVGNIPLDDVLAKREQINEELRVKLDDITHRWGVKVTNVEIKELTPPRDVQEAMNRQLTAERTRRAVVTEAEGKKASQILVADGAKQAAILEAEGARQSAILRAEGFALAISTINAQAMTADAKTMTLQYLDALKQLGASPSTKFIIPTEFTNLAAPISALVAARDGDKK